MIIAGLAAETDEGTAFVGEGIVTTSASSAVTMIARMDFPDIARLLVGYRSKAWALWILP